MASISARKSGLLALLVAAIATELVTGVLGLSSTDRSHSYSAHPVAAVVDAAYTQLPAVTLVDGVVPSTTVPTVSKSPAAKVAASPRHAVVRQAAVTAAARRTPARAAVASANSAPSGCAAAFAFLAAHSAPGFQFVCPGYAEGHQAMTCINTSACPGEHVIVIANACAAAYMNEAHNSWILDGLATGKIDPYGYC